MDQQELRQRCAALVRSLEIAAPFDIAEFCAQLGRRRGRPIVLVPLALGSPSPCGLWIASDSTDYVFYEQATTVPHQEHIIGHEIGHLLCGHSGPPLVADHLSRILMPDLSPDLVRRMLSRSSYTDQEEFEAELFASLFLERARVADHGQHVAVEKDARGDLVAVLDRLESALERPRRCRD